MKYAENWQVASVICSYTAMACYVLLIIAMIAFLLKYRKTMQAMLTAFLQTNTKNTAIQSVQADWIGRAYPPLFTINLPKEEEIIDDLREITTMEYVVQVIMIIVCITIVLIIMYFCCMKCRHTHTIFKYCFPFLLISRIVRTLRHTDLFVEVINVTKGNGIWAHFISTGCFLHRFNCQDQFKKMMYRLKPFVVYLNGLESIGQVLMLQGYPELRLICLTWHMFLYLWIMI